MLLWKINLEVKGKAGEERKKEIEDTSIEVGDFQIHFFFFSDLQQ